MAHTPDDAPGLSANPSTPPGEAVATDSNDGIPQPQPSSADSGAAASTDSLDAPLPVSGESLIAWNFWGSPQWNDDPATIAYYKQNLPRLRQAFEKKNGEIVTEYYCSHFVGGYVLTNKGKLVTVNNESGSGATDVSQIIEKAGQLADDAEDYLDGAELVKARRRCVELASYPISTALGLLDDTAEIDDSDRKADERSANSPGYKTSESQLDYARAYFDRVAKRAAQLRYFRGVVKGVLYVLGVGVISAALVFGGSRLASAHISVNAVIPVLLGVGGGALGALVSVMTRMTSGRLKIDVTAGEIQLVRLGTFRPVIGAIFGAAVTALIVGEVLPVSQPENSSHIAYFFGSIGFLAGFSERWAQDMLTQSEELLSASSDPKNTNAPPTSEVTAGR